MKLNCPSCKARIPAADVDLRTGWGKCAACDEVFPLTGVLEGYSPASQQGEPAGPVERPFDATTVVEVDATKLMIYVPPYGLRAATWAVIGFATFWLSFITFWTAGALGVFFNGGKPQLQNAWFASFSIPFWAVGFGMVGAALWMARGTRTVYIDAMEMQVRTACLLYRRHKTIDRSNVQWARLAETKLQKDNSSPQYAVEIVYENGSASLTCANEQEQKWLLAVINDFLRSTAAHPAR